MEAGGLPGAPEYGVVDWAHPHRGLLAPLGAHPPLAEGHVLMAPCRHPTLRALVALQLMNEHPRAFMSCDLSCNDNIPNSTCNQNMYATYPCSFQRAPAGRRHTRAFGLHQRQRACKPR